MVAAARSKPRDLFTASQVARFCQVDLKTIHNWADRGQIPHFRTPGRHLRFQRPHVLDFLRKYGYPIPDELEAERPRVAVLIDGEERGRSLAHALQGTFDVVVYAEPIQALLAIGEQPPDAVVLEADVGGLSGVTIIDALKREALDAGASAQVSGSDLGGLHDTLEALMGIGR